MITPEQLDARHAAQRLGEEAGACEGSASVGGAMSTPTALVFARAALAIHDGPKCGRRWEFIHVDEDGPVPIDGICSLVAGHRGLCGHAQPDGADWAHLRAALAEIDRLTAELAAVGGQP